MENGKACFRVKPLHAFKQLACRSAVGVVFKGALLQLFLVVVVGGIALYVFFVAETERTNDGKRHLAHPEFDGHGGEMSLEQ